MTHVFHHALDGYSPDQILHDGCDECEHRGRHLVACFAHMDDRVFDKAWRRAYDLHASSGNRRAILNVSRCEMKLLDALWGVQLQLERRGVELTGTPPGTLKPIYDDTPADEVQV